MGGTLTTNVNDLTAVHQTSTGLASAGPPDVCLTPNPTPGGSPVPVPYPNVAMSVDLVGGTQTVSVDGSSVAIRPSRFIKSTGDEPGVIGGVTCGRNMSEAEFTTFSPTVSMEGEPVCRLTDQMTMNARNTVTGGGVQQQPLPPAVAVVVPPPESPKICKSESLQGMCAHSDRAYLATTKRRAHERFQVIVSDKAEEITFDYDIHCGLTGGDNCAKLHVLGPDGEIADAATTHKLKIEPPKSLVSAVSDWFEFARYVLSSEPYPHRTYTIYTTACQGVEGASFSTGEFLSVEAYPAVKWKGKVSFGYKFEKVEVKNGEVVDKDIEGSVEGFDDDIPPEKRARVVQQLKRTSTWELDGEVEGQYGSHKFVFKLSDLKATEKSRKGEGAKANSDPLNRKLFAFTQGTINKFMRVLGSFADLDSSKVDIKWPKIVIEGEVERKEAIDDYYVYYGGAFFVGADPLIGADFSIDILDWLIIVTCTSIFPGAGAVLAKLLIRAKARAKQGLPPKRMVVGQEEQKMAAGFAADIGIVFTIGGSVGGGIGWVFDDQGVQPDPRKAGIKAELRLQLEAYIKVEAKVFIIKSAAGASIALKSADGKSPSKITGLVHGSSKPSKRGKPRAENYYDAVGRIEFNGLAISYSLYAEISGQGAEVKKKPEPGMKSGGTKKVGDGFASMFNKKWEQEGGLYTFLEPWVWPKPHTFIMEAL